MRLIPIITLAALFGFTGCGISVDGLGSIISDAECVIDQSKCADSTDTTDSEGTDSAETGTTASDGTNSSDPETGGGIMSETYDRVDGAFFMGTYQSMDFHTITTTWRDSAPTTFRGSSGDTPMRTLSTSRSKTAI